MNAAVRDWPSDAATRDPNAYMPREAVSQIKAMENHRTSRFILANRQSGLRNLAYFRAAPRAALFQDYP
jgi:hypothetical protein